MTRPNATTAQHLTGTTNGRVDVEEAIRRARRDARFAHLSQSKLSRIVRRMASEAEPVGFHTDRHGGRIFDPTFEDIAHYVDGLGLTSLGSFADRLARAGGAR